MELEIQKNFQTPRELNEEPRKKSDLNEFPYMKEKDYEAYWEVATELRRNISEEIPKIQKYMGSSIARNGKAQCNAPF